MVFKITNDKPLKESKPSETNGIGLANISQQLELVYPGKHKFQADDLGDQFRVKLTIDLEMVNEEEAD